MCSDPAASAGQKGCLLAATMHGTGLRMHDEEKDLATIARIEIIQTVLRVLRETTSLRMALVARVTGDSWTACAVLDDAGWGLNVGGKLEVSTTY